MPANVIVFAGAIHDRYLSALWKTFFDRSFYRGHAPSLIGKQIGFIVSGPLSQLANLRQILTAWTELQRSNLVGFVSDEGGDAAAVDTLLAALAENLIRCAVEGYISPRSFLGVGGQKLFRDEIWGPPRAVFQADHRAYKRLGIYDFPQHNWGVRALNAAATVLFKIPKVREMVYGQMKEQMVAPYKKVIEGA